MTRDEQTVRELFAALDAGNTQAALELMTEDVLFRFGSAPPSVGRDDVAANATAMATVVASLSHKLLAVWTVEDPQPAVIGEAAVTYERHDGSRLTLPCVSVFRLREGRVADYRIYMDINPVFAPQAV